MIAGLERQIKKLYIEHIQYCIKKADVFYQKTRIARVKRRRNELVEAVCIDYHKNLPVPNTSTNDVYYRRQLSVYTFNIPGLSSGKSVFYTYPKTVGNKGSDDVYSMIHNFVYNHIDEKVRCLYLFCDSCGGVEDKIKTTPCLDFFTTLFILKTDLMILKYVFPLEAILLWKLNKNMGIIDQKSKVELPRQWDDVFRSARVNSK